MVAFDKASRHPTPDSTSAHFYVDDVKLARLLRRPLTFVDRLSRFGSVISPDFSLYRDMFRHQRISHTFLNRYVGAVFERHGLLVIPNVRWATEEDFDFCFDGIEKFSMVAISTHGSCQTDTERRHFRSGIAALLETIEPRQVLVHGPSPYEIFRGFTDQVAFKFFWPDIRKAHPPQPRPPVTTELPFGDPRT